MLLIAVIRLLFDGPLMQPPCLRCWRLLDCHAPLPAVLNDPARLQGDGEPQIGPALDMVSLFSEWHVARDVLRQKRESACWSHSKHIPTA